VTWHAFANKKLYKLGSLMSARMEFLPSFLPSLLKGSRISEGFQSLLQYTVTLQHDTLHVFLGKGNERRHSHVCYACKVWHRLYYFVCLVVNGVNTDSFILLTPIDFLSSVRTFMLEVMEMSKDFPHCFPYTIILYC
jgi:hypothetical protein